MEVLVYYKEYLLIILTVVTIINMLIFLFITGLIKSIFKFALYIKEEINTIANLKLPHETNVLLSRPITRIRYSSQDIQNSTYILKYFLIPASFIFAISLICFIIYLIKISY